MRDTFPGFYRPTDAEFTELWNDCVFVLDANVLLNLYRYSKATSDDLLKVLKSVRDRLWVPYQTALEYQRNRLGVVAEQVKKFAEVKKVLKGTQDGLVKGLADLQLQKRHPTIDPDALLDTVRLALEGFSKELGELEEKQPDVADDDKLRDEIDELLSGRVGDKTTSQDALDNIYAEGKVRYARRQPPGYMDADKAGDENECYSYGDLCYQKQFGDLVLWYQIIDEAKNRAEPKRIIFITDDDKTDWWWAEDSKGRKTIGPRPELVEEIRSKAGVSLFYMYNSERLMEYAEKYLEVKVSKESIKQARDFRRFAEQLQAQSSMLERMRQDQANLASFSEQLQRTPDTLSSLRRSLELQRKHPFLGRRLRNQVDSLLETHQSAADTELANVQAAVTSMMVDNELTRLPNPVGTATTDMAAFPDATSAAGSADKLADVGGNTYIDGVDPLGDKDGFLLFGHDRIAGDDQLALTNYINTQFTMGTYTVNAAGTVTQVTTGYE